jgi:hypothetical protein
MKYIVAKDEQSEFEFEYIILFPDILQHVIIANGLAIADMDVVSAGFVDDDCTHCFGQSVSLNLCARVDEDTELLNALLRKQRNYAPN